ncbi:hypothetical protein NUW54_g8240 [Trametes sanguinea]|uniref:Uncharacterized protein n=1 Tax=Trametes sanguinea TaxID=158606 RepID=A0ACC1PG37_9APHY|nr:hypothetical protein NUW54_g8240 [Trametes sanguinea]
MCQSWSSADVCSTHGSPALRAQQTPLWGRSRRRSHRARTKGKNAAALRCVESSYHGACGSNAHLKRLIGAYPDWLAFEASRTPKQAVVRLSRDEFEDLELPPCVESPGGLRIAPPLQRYVERLALTLARAVVDRGRRQPEHARRGRARRRGTKRLGFLGEMLLSSAGSISVGGSSFHSHPQRSSPIPHAFLPHRSHSRSDNAAAALRENTSSPTPTMAASAAQQQKGHTSPSKPRTQQTVHRSLSDGSDPQLERAHFCSFRRHLSLSYAGHCAPRGLILRIAMGSSGHGPPQRPPPTRTYDSSSSRARCTASATSPISPPSPPPLSATPSNISLAPPPGAPSAASLLAGARPGAEDSPWTSLHVLVLPLFNEEPLRVPM